MESLDALERSVGLEYLSSTSNEMLEIKEDPAIAQGLEPISNDIVTIDNSHMQNDKMQ